MYFSVNKLRYELRCWLPGLPPFCVAKHLLTLHPGRGILRRNVYDVLQAACVPDVFLRPPTSGPSSRCVPAPTYKRPVFQMCSCAHQQAARVPDVFLRPPTSGPSSRCVPAPTYKRPVFQRSVPAPTQRGPCPKGVSLFQEPRSLLYQPCSAGNVTQRFCYI